MQKMFLNLALTALLAVSGFIALKVLNLSDRVTAIETTLHINQLVQK